MIINLQKTPKDKKANLVIHAKCDEIMEQLMTSLLYPIPSYTRQDAVLVSHTLKKSKRLQELICTISVQSVHGPKCPLPLVLCVSMDFQVSMLSLIIMIMVLMYCTL